MHWAYMTYMYVCTHTNHTVDTHRYVRYIHTCIPVHVHIHTTPLTRTGTFVTYTKMTWQTCIPVPDITFVEVERCCNGIAVSCGYPLVHTSLPHITVCRVEDGFSITTNYFALRRCVSHASNDTSRDAESGASVVVSEYIIVSKTNRMRQPEPDWTCENNLWHVRESTNGQNL